MYRLFQYFMRSYVRTGNLRVILPNGADFVCGDGAGEQVTIRITTFGTLLKLIIDPELKLGETYMDGTLAVDRGDIADALAILIGQGLNKTPRWSHLQWLLRYCGRALQQFNPRGRSRKNVAHHYDLDARLYSLFLDADKQYSCAYFETPDSSLDEAQLAKKRHFAAKLRLMESGKKVLDIGCGWGGLGLYLADMTGANVTGITLSEEQFAIARSRAQERNLAERANFRLQDYRDLSEPFDRIVSVGMFEHVGVNHYDTYFQKCAELLADDGVMVLHSIGRSEPPGITNPWIAKYIFPGGYIPALSEVLPAIERAGLLVTDIEILRLHYAETLKAWRERFLARQEDVLRFYDERFVRMWDFYLAASEMAFRKQAMMNFQIQITKRQDVVPMTRDYIAREESRLRNIEADRRPKLQIAGE